MIQQGITPETNDTWQRMCAYWAKIITTKSENGVHIWPPCDSPYYQVRRFLADKDLQRRFLKDLTVRMAIIDGYEQENISFDELEQQIIQSMGLGESNLTSLEEMLKKSSSELFVLFVTGFDTVLKHNNTVSLQRLATLPSRYTISNLKIIFFTEFNILDSEAYPVLLRSSNLLQNVAYESLLHDEDIQQFSHYIARQWNLPLPEWLDTFLIEDIGGHPLLLKEAIRLFRDNEKITREELLQNSSLVRKAVVIYQRLSAADRETVGLILQGDEKVYVSEYLLDTQVVVAGRLGIRYWYHIKQKYFCLPSVVKVIQWIFI